MFLGLYSGVVVRSLLLIELFQLELLTLLAWENGAGELMPRIAELMLESYSYKVKSFSDVLSIYPNFSTYFQYQLRVLAKRKS